MGAYEGAFTVAPVKLISFSALLQNGTAQLQWQTATEDNFNHFELQQSTDAQNYTTTATILAKGNNSNYSFSNKQQEARLYYRLRIVDNNGQFTYSNVLVLSQQATTIALQLYPNPAQNYIVVRLQKAAALTIYDASGRLLKAQKYLQVLLPSI